MAKRSGGVPVVVSLDGRSGTTLQRQLYEGLRAAILGGRLQSGKRLPSTRSLAKDLAANVRALQHHADPSRVRSG